MDRLLFIPDMAVEHRLSGFVKCPGQAQLQDEMTEGACEIVKGA